jgi:hypothetical protein
MTRLQKLDWLVGRILREKELLDCEHIRKAALAGCHCRRCKTARVIAKRSRVTGKRARRYEMGYEISLAAPKRDPAPQGEVRAEKEGMNVFSAGKEGD